MASASLLDRALVVDGCQFAEGAFPSRVEWIPPTLRGGLFFTVHGSSFREAALEIARIHELASRHPDRLRVVRAAKELRGGSLGIVLAFQDPAPIENRIDALRAFYELGLRVLQLTYNKANYIGTGCAETEDMGLTDFGREVVHTMNRLGMIVDLSHVSRRTALEAIELSEHPVVFSHACTRALSENPRNRSDEELRALAAKGGVIGLTPWSPICWKRERDEPPTLEDYLDHVEHAASVAGPDHIGFGSDQTVDGSADEAGIRLQGSLYPQVVGEFDRRVGTSPNVRYPKGFRGVSDLGRVVEGLSRRGVDEETIEKFLGRNFERVLARVLGESHA